MQEPKGRQMHLIKTSIIFSELKIKAEFAWSTELWILKKNYININNGIN